MPAELNGAAAQDTPADDGTQPVTPDETSGAKTPEEIEAYWRNRVSKKDAGHAAAEKALREELETLRKAQASSTASPASGGQSGTENGGEAADLRRQIEERDRRIEQQQKLFERKGKYPLLAAQGLEDEVFVTASEASLAKLNALADDEPRGTLIAPTGPKRGSPTPPKPMHEKSKEELLADLREATKGMTGI